MHQTPTQPGTTSATARRVFTRSFDEGGAKRAYNLFRRSDKTDLICVVSEDRPVPPFIRGPLWEFVGRFGNVEAGATSFNSKAADASIQYNGFYLFQLIRSADLSLLLEPERSPPEKDGWPVDETDRTDGAASGMDACPAGIGSSRRGGPGFDGWARW